MKKQLLVLAILLICPALGARAQFNVGVSLGSAMFPSSNFGEGIDLGVSFDLLGKYTWNETLAIGFDVGYTKFMASGGWDVPLSNIHIDYITFARYLE